MTYVFGDKYSLSLVMSIKKTTTHWQETVDTEITLKYVLSNIYYIQYVFQSHGWFLIYVSFFRLSMRHMWHYIWIYWFRFVDYYWCLIWRNFYGFYCFVDWNEIMTCESESSSWVTCLFTCSLETCLWSYLYHNI